MSFPETSEEQRQVFYEDLEACLRPGFIHHSVVVGGVHLVLRSPTNADLLLIRARGFSQDVIDWKRWCIATCTWIISGQVVLGELNVASQVYEVLRHIPDQAFEKLFGVFLGLRNRVTQALRGLSAYCLENLSRQYWYALNGSPPSLDSITGIPGTSKLGINMTQRLWMTINVMEDERLYDRRQWHMLRNTLQMDKKAWDKMISSERSSDTLMREERQTERDLFYYRSIGALGWEEDFEAVESALKFKAKTVKDLQGEFYRWVAGEQDEHDQIIEGYKSQVREAYLKIQRRQELRRQKLLEAASGNLGISSRVKMVGYTTKQLAELLKREPRKRGVTTVQDAPIAEYVYDRYMREAPSAGRLKVEEGQLLVEDPSSLQEQVTSRTLDPDILERWG